jgi:hypothetical protein
MGAADMFGYDHVMEALGEPPAPSSPGGKNDVSILLCSTSQRVCARLPARHNRPHHLFLIRNTVNMNRIQVVLNHLDIAPASVLAAPVAADDKKRYIEN